MWQIYSRKHLQRISIRSSGKQWVYGNESQFKVKATVVLFPCSLLKQGFKEATMGITSCASCLFVCLFVCLFLAPQSVARGGSVA
jgi:hypothetical protein